MSRAFVGVESRSTWMQLAQRRANLGVAFGQAAGNGCKEEIGIYTMTNERSRVFEEEKSVWHGYWQPFTRQSKRHEQ
jgi:hypothetical protein